MFSSGGVSSQGVASGGVCVIGRRGVGTGVSGMIGSGRATGRLAHANSSGRGSVRGGSTGGNCLEEEDGLCASTSQSRGSGLTGRVSRFGWKSLRCAGGAASSCAFHNAGLLRAAARCASGAPSEVIASSPSILTEMM
jgi:hypothetical protein